MDKSIAIIRITQTHELFLDYISSYVKYFTYDRLIKNKMIII